MIKKKTILKLLVITLTLTFISCGDAEPEVKKVKTRPKPTSVIKEVKAEVVEEKEEELEINEEDYIEMEFEKVESPFPRYVTAEQYKNGLKAFSRNQEYFTENRSLFKQYYDGSKNIVTEYELAMILYQNGRKTAVIYKTTEKGKKRIFVEDSKNIKVGDTIYKVKVLEGKIELLKQGSSKVITIYQRGR
ncbi:MAG: hypothetical protein KAH04_01985 [Psychrilyobacter sp.]|nr:hypothetical protein [Psychrilyobacter sp.]